MIRPDPLSPAAQAYLAAVDARLRDLAPADHAELLAEVQARLADLDPSPSPVAVLGPPAAFAADLRRAAGYDPGAVLVAERPAPLLDWCRLQAQRAPVAAVLDYLRSLRPAWWAVRGYLLVTLPLLLVARPTEHWGLHTLGFYSEAIQARAVNAGGGFGAGWALLLVLAAVVGSVVLGRVTPRLAPRWRLGVVALDVLAGFVLVAWPTWWLAPTFAYVSGLAG